MWETLCGVSRKFITFAIVIIGKESLKFSRQQETTITPNYVKREGRSSHSTRGVGICGFQQFHVVMVGRLLFVVFLWCSAPLFLKINVEHYI